MRVQQQKRCRGTPIPRAPQALPPTAPKPATDLRSFTPASPPFKMTSLVIPLYLRLFPQRHLSFLTPSLMPTSKPKPLWKADDQNARLAELTAHSDDPAKDHPLRRDGRSF